jgi:hypothetical protein
MKIDILHGIILGFARQVMIEVTGRLPKKLKWVATTAKASELVPSE